MKMICPVCGAFLTPEPKRYFCEKGHSFDRAKSGYVNLLQRQSSRRRGDDAEMAKARQLFLNAGYYQKLLDRICAIAEQVQPTQIMDVGCGEGWYSCAVTSVLRSKGIMTGLCGIDISPDILRFAAVRAKQQGIADADWAVASVSHLPAADHSCDCILNLFAPCEPHEFLRVMKPDGLLLRVIPLEKHLWELKEVLYDAPYENTEKQVDYPGFRFAGMEPVETAFTLRGSEEIQALFHMTPYTWKTAREGAERLRERKEMHVTAQFRIHRFVRI